jgi:hypothetical protein
MNINKTLIPVLLLSATLLGCQRSAKNGAADNTLKRNRNMNSNDYTTVIEVDQLSETAFKAVADFRGWWSEDIQGPTDELHQAFFYHYKDVHLCKLKLIEKIDNQRLVYEVIDNQFNFVADKTEWIGTKLIFELSPKGKGTKIVFTHQGLVPEYECYKVCQDAWTSYIQGSLKQLIETGKGKPNGKEGGLNAELVQKWGLPDK